MERMDTGRRKAVRSKRARENFIMKDAFAKDKSGRKECERSDTGRKAKA